MKTLFIILSTIISIHANCQVKHFYLEFHVTQIPKNTRVFLVNYPLEAQGLEADTVATCLSTEGIFSLTCPFDIGPDFYHIVLERTNQSLPLFIDDDSVIIQADYANWPRAKVTGSSTHEEFVSFFQTQKHYRSEWDSLNNKAIAASTVKDTSLAIQFEIRRDAMNDTLRLLWRDYIERHPNSLYTPFLILKTNGMDRVEKFMAYKKLSPGARSSKYGIELKKYLEADEK